MKIYKIIAAAALAFAVLALSSCEAVKQVTYFQDLGYGSTYKPAKEAQIRMKPQDKLTIIVKSKDPELASLFNLSIATSQVGVIAGTSSSYQLSYYTIDEQGFIDFPFLGKLKVDGMTRSEIAEYIKIKLQEADLIKELVVTVEYADLAVSVMGEVARPGRYEINKDYYTILDALSAAGDMTIFGMRESVVVLRQEEDVQRAYMVNMTSAADVYASPVFYMQQNDIIYVEPSKTRARQAVTSGNSLSSTSFWISLGSLAATITAILLK